MDESLFYDVCRLEVAVLRQMKLVLQSKGILTLPRSRVN